MNVLAPIVVFTYNRPEHTLRTLNALLINPLANESDIIIYSDSARTANHNKAVDEVRSYLSDLTGFRSIKVIHRYENFGLAESIIQGVTEVLQRSEKVIVLEDDMVVSPYFLEYMNEALEKFFDDDRVISVHGYVYPVKIELPEAFFLTGADCWGWATWRRGWDLFNSEGKYLLDELVRRHLIQEFDYNGAYPFLSMLKDQIKGANDSWAIRWHASAFLAGKLTLYPGRSLVHNIGTDSSGTHCGDLDNMDAKLSETKIKLNNIAVESSPTGREAFENFFRQSQKKLLNRLLGKAECLFRKK
jgi:hypothetical protein